MAKRNVDTKETKKQMKAVEVKAAPNFDMMHKLFTKVMGQVKGLTLHKNAHGAIQVKDERGLLFSARSDGAVIITHPMYEGKGKDRKRIYGIGGGKWDELSQVPFAEVTAEMLITRAKDTKSRAEYHDLLYKGREEEAGLYKKSEAAKARIAKAKAEANGKTKAVKREAKAAKSVMVDKKVAKKVPPKAIRKAVQAVAGK